MYRIGLGVYAIGRLAGAEADALAAHLNGCPPCRAELARLRDVAELLARSARQWNGGVPPHSGAVPPHPSPARRRGSAGRGPRTGASGTGLSGACAYGAAGPGRSR
ncbi:Putative zinc-finger [Actinomadura mexicana]|uniref:Putative zinc-finger n=1 Tax=Actinomadura mexicana TaxID=134959 RepID=A0A238UYW1_9ACTN|nr:Putative zinc-finger [Actinomadura mexicana]